MDVFEILDLMNTACPVKCSLFIIRKSPCEIELQWEFSLKTVVFVESQVVNSFEGLESAKRAINSASINIRTTLENSAVLIKNNNRT